MRVHHIGYLVKKLEKAERELSELGYLCEAPVVYDEIRRVDISFWKNGETRIELVSPRSQDSVVYELLKSCKNMPYHICYLSENIEQDVEKLRDRGFFLIDTPTPAPALNNRRVCFLMGSASGMIELLEE